MKKEDLYDEIGQIDDDLIEEAYHIKKRIFRNRKFIRIGAAAACLAILAVIGVPMLRTPSVAKAPDLTHLSGGVTARYIEEAPSVNQSTKYSKLVFYTPEEIFKELKLVIFKGTVQKICNIEINDNGFLQYMAIATIQVDTVYRGSMRAGDSINILLPCAINNGTWTEDCDVISELMEGMTGIFMPAIYEDTSDSEKNSDTFSYKEIADYGLRDGERFAFLDTKEELVFDKSTYSEIENVTSLDQVGEYIKKMIK